MGRQEEAAGEAASGSTGGEGEAASGLTGGGC